MKVGIVPNSDDFRNRVIEENFIIIVKLITSI